MPRSSPRCRQMNQSLGTGPELSLFQKVQPELKSDWPWGTVWPDGIGTVTVEEKERFEEIKERLRVLLENQITHFRLALLHTLEPGSIRLEPCAMWPTSPWDKSVISNAALVIPDLKPELVLMKDIVTPVPQEEVKTVIRKCLEQAALVNYSRLSEYAKIEENVGRLITPAKKLEDTIRLAELVIEVLQQNEEHHAEVSGVWEMARVPQLRLRNGGDRLGAFGVQVMAFAWWSDLMVEHAETFLSLFAVDMDAALEVQPPDTWDSFPLFQLLNDFLRTDYNLCNGKFHKHLQDLFAPLVVRYVDLMESSIAQSIHRGFERESWEPVKGMTSHLCKESEGRLIAVPIKPESVTLLSEVCRCCLAVDLASLFTPVVCFCLICIVTVMVFFLSVCFFHRSLTSNLPNVNLPNVNLPKVPNLPVNIPLGIPQMPTFSAPSWMAAIYDADNGSGTSEDLFWKLDALQTFIRDLHWPEEEFGKHLEQRLKLMASDMIESCVKRTRIAFEVKLQKTSRSTDFRVPQSICTMFNVMVDAKAQSTKLCSMEMGQEHQYHSKIDELIEETVKEMITLLVAKFVTILEGVLAKLSRYDEGTLFSSFLSFTVSKEVYIVLLRKYGMLQLDNMSWQRTTHNVSQLKENLPNPLL
ncbi:hypothetical protein QTO34_006926 [Cnephaeus nilssonii]|uniref:MHD1 domain-containing protein n=1 Tax=Cnephaeus nilssonii TaxID=3371016 RepID=A0AA40HJA7_CNENI|nr:hypothetical protein QTO34_006926 [Eptesicus nilssonii]